ncbi:MAG TPA: hypothetical protein VKB14_10980 [Actinomycetales bacterium]|nr:hypothetical protein [Actinomycetales bacterium]
MWTATSQTGSLTAAVTLALTIGLAAPAAAARPRLETGSTQDCRAGKDGSAAALRAAGLSAQAANILPQIAYRDCLHASH